MLNNFKVGTRLFFGFGLVMALLLLVGGYAIKSIKGLDEQIELVVNDRMVKVGLTQDVMDHVNIIARALRNVLIDDSKDRQAAEFNRIAESRKIVGERVEELNRKMSTDKGKELIRKVIDARGPYVRQTESYMALIKEGQLDQAKKMLLSEVRNTQAAYVASIQEICTYIEEVAKKDGEKAEVAANTATRTVAVLMGIALVLSAVLAVIIARGITIPAHACTAFLQMLAQNDFSKDVPELFRARRDEFGTLANATQAMVNNTRQLLKDTLQGVQVVATSSNDLAAVSRQLTSAAKDTADKSGAVAAAAEQMNSNMQSVSAAMEQSSSNVNMVASSTEEMTATVNEIAHNAEKARSISEGAVKQSRQATEKMTLLGETARKIGRVTETITEISEQTNLLALNATIEAARAGEAGKGFAVVANEIKELARQTADATVDIKNQIGGMQTTTATTVEDIDRISQVITEINSVIQGIATAVEEQSAASSEISGNIAQASQGIAEVNENVAQSTVVIADMARDIAGINQQAAQVGEGSGQVQVSAQGLSEMAAQLDALVKKFKV